MWKDDDDDENAMYSAEIDKNLQQMTNSRSQSPVNEYVDDNKSHSSWRKMEDDKGNEYFYDDVTGHSQVPVDFLIRPLPPMRMQ